MWNLSLDTVVVRGNTYSRAVRNRADGSFVWDMQMMDYLPKILGNADPLHYAQMLPGIQTNNEMKSGINIQGCDNSHNMLSIGGVPIYNVSHLLGFFSTFNPSHYPTFTLHQNAPLSIGRIGGQLNMDLNEQVVDTMSGEVSVGLISSQGTLRLPISKNTSLTASLRGSYINMLYSKWLQADDQQIKYSFYDVNATLTHRIDSQNMLFADFYMGHDDISFSESNYYAKMKDFWGNTMGALHWVHQQPQGFRMKHSLYVTSYANEFKMDLQDAHFQLPSSITDYGYQSRFEWKRWEAGLQTLWHNIQPQELESSGTFNVTSGRMSRTHSFEAAVHLGYTQPLLSNLSLFGGLRASLYQQDDYHFKALDPQVNLQLSTLNFQLILDYALRHQYLFQTGFSNIGLPSEFWMSASEKMVPQYAHEWSLSAASYLFNRQYRLSADIFYKKLYHQLEYSGSVLDFINSTYNIERQLLHGDGRNYGFCLMLNKCSGPLTGWVSYTYTNAKRSFSAVQPGDYPASHERPHEFNAVATYALNSHWSFGATFVYASGTPFTAPVSISFIDNNLMMKYGPYNSSRLKPYKRLDLSANYKWKSRMFRENGINLSVYNAIAQSNELFYYIKSRKDGSFAYRPVTFMLRIMPSISYFCKF
ncbi:TonB-dependent receptor [uncultured Prevotella sp.]|uniref:TonB-dependent receptor plug domain-containing protein n=1 Tax=uncultured Prevotella sp. TaxID=159272 RepID=UPI0025EC1D54|nr:TonB-dependent receptor [uncultured Prevotella sp.]